jgi:DNA polymerase-3 subunit delta
MGLAEDIIKSGKYPPVIFFFGKEEFLADEAYRKLLKELLKDDAASFNFDSFDCSDKETTPERISGACNSAPMMGDKRITAVTEFDSMYSLSKGKKADLEKDPLVRYIQNPSPTTVLIIKCGFLSSLRGAGKKGLSQKKIEGLKPPFDTLIGKHAWQEFPEIYDNQVPNWIVSRFKSSGYSIDITAASLLAALVDTDLRVLSNTIERTITHNPDKKQITVDDVNYLIGQSRHYNVFELEKAVGRKDLGTALKIMNEMLKGAGEEILIVARLTTYFSTLWKLAEEIRKGATGPALAGKIGVHPMFVSDYVRAGKLYSPAQINNAFLRLTDADIKIKTTQTDRYYLMQELLMKIMS